MSLSQILWHIYGVVGIAVLVLVFPRLKATLKGSRKKIILITVGTGLVAGVVGIIAFIALEIFTPAFSFISDSSPLIRGLFSAPGLYFFSFLFACLAGRPLRAYCQPTAVIYVALCTCAIVLSYPMWFQWLKGAWRFLL